MRKFYDTEGRAWELSINVSSAKRIKSLAGVDVVDVTNQENDALQRLATDEILLCDVVYATIKPQADSIGVTDEQFGESMSGDSLGKAAEALMEEIADFSRSPRDRAHLRRIIQTTDRAMDKARDIIENRLDSGILDQAVDETLKQWTSGEKSGDSQASRE